MKNRVDSGILYQLICATFCILVVMSNIIAAKMVVLPYIDFTVPAGLLTYPLTFLLSDLVTEVFGARYAKQVLYIALGMSVLSFCIIQFAISMPTDMLDEHRMFESVLGLNGVRVFASLAAYFISQMVDVRLYVWIKQWTGPRLLWLRNNGSTCVSQLIDTVIVDMIFLYWGLKMEMALVFPIIVFSYVYKAFFSFACTPVFYLSVASVRKRI